MQSDAIVVVESNKNKNGNENNFFNEEEEINQQQSDSLNFLFCNSKSIELFGFDFSALD